MNCITSVRFYPEQGILEGSIFDITDRKQAEAALRESEEQYRQFVDNSSEAIVVVQDGFLKFVNRMTMILLGYPEIEILTKPYAEFIYPDDRARVAGNFAKLLAGEFVPPRNSFRIITGKDAVRWVEIGSVLIDWQGRPATLSFLIDTTDRKKTEEALYNVQKLESLGVLAGGIAHDFNNLMGGVFGYIDLAIEKSEDPVISGYLSRTMNAIDRARALTRQLLTFAKGGAPMRKTGDLFPFVAETARFALSGAPVSCEFDVADGLKQCIFDKNQIGQVVDNIIINARQAMPGGGSVLVTARNVAFGENGHPVLAAGEYLKLSIKDSGVGMQKEILPRIFDPFFTTKSTGHGLGLATCYSIVSRHGGCIDVESEPGLGSTFHVYLPAAAGTGLPEVNEVVRHEGKGVFVVMDDQEVMRDTIGDMLKGFGYSVVCLANGKDAVDFFVAETGAKRNVTGMLFDLTIPGGMGGKEAIGEIRKMCRSTPVFVASGYADNPVMATPEAYGFTASICKPFRKSDLAKMLNRFMKKQR